VWHNVGKMRLQVLSCLFFAGVVLASAPVYSQRDPLRKAASLIKSDRPVEAEAVLRTIGEQDPEFASARTITGFLLLRRAALAEAEAAFREALQHAPDSGASRFGLGAVLLRKGAPEAEAGLLAEAGADPVVREQAQAEWIRSLFLAEREEEAGIPQAGAAVRTLSTYRSPRVAP
jgi:Tfp pilus assembly protein PilF